MINLNELPDDDQDELPPSVGLVQTGNALFYTQPTTRVGGATTVEYFVESPNPSVTRKKLVLRMKQSI